ncbi:GMP synthase [glutamine-hydrolyzing] [Weissella viridescens]|uniref:Glutamine amidotransferase n=1 Tax=Weissella viridescens TaxID=1629 RepID=A0A380NWG2_WEIVI|nr:GMP synthase [glutamine-hydrolyzing] [Weissella viridescens]
MKILENFIDNAVHADRTWSMDDFIEEQLQAIRDKVGDKKVLLGLSGGVDSSVVGVCYNAPLVTN